MEIINNDIVNIVNNNENSILTLNFKNNDIKKDELCAAALSFFFAGKMTQDQFSIGMKFFNLMSDIKLPIRFNNIKNYVCSNRQDRINYEKKNFYRKCQLLIKTVRYQRNCSICKSRYNHAC